MKKLFAVFLLIIIICSCESNVAPKVYDKTYSTIETQLKLIHYLIDIRNFEKAQTQIEKNLSIYPDNFDLILMQGWLKLQENDFEQASQILTKLHEDQKKVVGEKNYNPLICIGLARIARLKEDYKTAQVELDHVKNKGNLLSVYWTEQGFIHYEQSNYEEAEKAFFKAQLMDKNNIDATFYRYICQLQLGIEIDEIKQSWLNMTKTENFSALYYQIHAKTLYELGKFELCKHVLQEGLTHFERNLYLNNFYAYILYEEYTKTLDTATLAEAKSHIEPCMENYARVEPEFVDTYLHILEELKDFATIEETLEQYYLIFPDSKEIIWWLRKYGS